MTKRKIILIGSGAVGTAFLYSAMNQGLASEYGIIDLNEKFVDGNVLDFEDVSAAVEQPFHVYKASYKDCKTADIVVITAGRAQREGETRLDLVKDNAKIMKGIAQAVKKSGFQGITVIASNPVDLMTLVYQQVTGFDHKKVVGSGTSLDSARLTAALAHRFCVAPSSIEAFVLGEHGDSSVSAFSIATVAGQPLKVYEGAQQMTKDDCCDVHESVWKKAYEIINRKGATFYGIGAVLAKICLNIFTDSHKVMALGAYLEGQYENEGIYTGVPVIIGANGIERIVELKISRSEQNQFNKSTVQLKKVYQSLADVLND